MTLTFIRNKFVLYIIGQVLLTSLFAQNSKYSSTSSFPNYNGLIMAGYQGWFNTPDDGSGRGWRHLSRGKQLDTENVSIELWPSVKEYPKTYPTSIKDTHGKDAHIFSSADASTTDLHFKWMQQYGIDGVFMQRFVNEIKSPLGRNHFTKVLAQAMTAAEKYHRAISVMYDLSGMNDGDYEVIINDWKMLTDSLKIASRGNQQSYLYQNNKPLVVLWGVGFSDKRKYTLQSIQKLLDFFKNDAVYGNCAVMLGVPTFWRTLQQDAVTDPKLLKVMAQADIVSPWMVGRYNEKSYPDFLPRIKEDINWCNQRNISYAPVVFPGFSWHNLKKNNDFNQIPRNGGSFFWKQVFGAIQSGAQMLYVAMFDELDEGTAILKLDKNPPGNKDKFVSFEKDIPEDYYLQLAGKAGKVLKKQIPLSSQTPLPDKKSVWNNK